MDNRKDTICTDLFCDIGDCPYYEGSSNAYICLDSCPIYHFTHGECIPFAIALHGIFNNYPLSCIKDEKLNYKVIHAFCKNPYNENTVIDARGVKPLKYILDVVYKNQGYSEKDVYDITEDGLFKEGGIRDSEIKKAKTHIKKYMGKYKVDDKK